MLEPRSLWTSSRSRGGDKRSPRRVTAAAAAGVVTGIVLTTLGGGAALAAADDRAEAEGLFLSGGGLVDLDAVAALAGAYRDLPPGGVADAAIDSTALSLIDLGLGMQLFGGNDVLTLGATGQYGRAVVGNAFASSGLIGSDGAIQAGTGAPGENTTLNLGPVLEAVGVDALIDTLSLELGAVSASAQATRAPGAVTVSSDYQIASGELTLTSPVLGEVAQSLDATLASTSTSVNALAGDGGPIDTTVGGLLGGIDAILEGLLLGLVDLDDPSVTATLSADLGAALDAVSDDRFVSGPLSLTLGSGEIVIDLDELYALNDLPANTTLLSDAGLNPTIAEALSDILTDQLPTALSSALDTVLNTTSLDISIAAGVRTVLPIGNLAITIDGTLGGFLGTPGSAPPAVSLEGTDIAGLPVGSLLTPITGYVLGTIVPAVGAVVGTTSNVEALEGSLTATLTSAVSALQPVLAALNRVVTIVVNVQEEQGEFRDPNGLDAGSFTQRAVALTVAPGITGGAIALDLASATVRAIPLVVPANLAMTPVRGPLTGGTDVTITGDNLGDVTEILFGTVPVESFTIDPDGDIRTTAPSQAAPGAVPVTVTNSEGSTSTLTFTYYNVTRIDGIAPDSGSTAGGDPVTITGTCFTGATQVLFGDQPGTDLTVVSDTEIRVLAPAGAVGPVDVTVVNPTECGDATQEDAFTYVEPDAPVLTSIVPGRGPETGGTSVTITGDDFTRTTSVTVDGVEVPFTVVNDTEITVVTPPHAPGVVDVVVTNEVGPSEPMEFEYFDVAEIDGVEPGSGPEAGGDEVVITGDCFTGATAVLFGGTAATGFVVNSDTRITAIVPAGTGIVDVSVVGAGDCGTAVVEDAYEYIAPPVVADLEPTSGPETGGTVVTITGEGFTGATGVTFDGIPGTGFTVVSDTEIRVTTPAHAPATVPVVVQHPVADADAGRFTFVPGTEIDGVEPEIGPEAGGNTVTITGSCFTGATEVLFGDRPAMSFTVVSDTQITAVAPAGVGIVDITVVGSAACGEDTLPDGYEYLDEPVITSLEPASGPETGGTAVTITGWNFTGVTSVTFDGVPGTDLTVVSDTEIRVTTPPGTPGPALVLVTGPDGISDPGSFVYYPVTDVDGTRPGTGPTGGGTIVTITGQCFTGATAVLFGGIPATEFQVVNDTTIRALTPKAATAGTVDVTVVGAGTCGTGVLEDGFRYVAGAAAGGSLAQTGSGADATFLALLGGMLLLLGALAVFRRRRTA